MAISEWRKEYNRKNKEKLKEWNKKSISKWRDKNKDKTQAHHNNWRDKNKLRCNIASQLSRSLKNKGYSKSSKTSEILGCTFEEFKQHIESQFEPWMNWDNYGGRKVDTPKTSWDIDHIIPVSSASTSEEILKLNHYTNLRPLCAYDNRFIKRNHI